MRFLILLLAFPLSLFAGPYRAVAYKFRTFGGLATGFLTWVGAIVAIPALLHMYVINHRVDFGRYLGHLSYVRLRDFQGREEFREITYALGFWVIVLIATMTQMVIRWFSKHPVRDRWRNHSWMSWGEFFFVVLIIGLGFKFDWKLVSGYLIVAYSCSLLQLPLFRLHKYLSDRPRPEKVPKQKTVATQKTAIAANFQQQVMPDGQVIYVQTRSPSFTSRVMSHMVASWLMSGLWWGLLSGHVFGMILAVPLWLLGWKVEAPMDVKEEGQAFMSRINEVVGDKRDEFSERLSSAKEGARERIDDIKEEAHDRVVALKYEAREKVNGLKEDAREKVDEFKDRVEDKRKDVKAEIKRQRNAAFWSVFGY